MQDEQGLRKLNIELGEAEKRGDKDFFERYLAEDLIFRRAKGAVITKQQFLYDLQTDAFDKLVTDVVDVKVYEDSTVVTVNVTAKRKGQDEGKYLNIRRFVKRKGQWQLIAWLNTEIKSA